VRLKLYRGRWAIVWRDGGKTKRRSTGTADRATAERILADMRSGPVPDAGSAVSMIYAAYMADLQERGKSADRAAFAWKRLADTFGNMRPDQVTRVLCRRYAVERRKAGAGDGTISTELGRLATALRWADKRTPAVIERPAKPEPKSRWLTKDEYRALRDAADADHLRLFIVLALSTAGRKSAVLGLTWDKIDFERGLIDLGGAVGGKGRGQKPMTTEAREALTVAHSVRTGASVIEYGGKPVASIDKAFRSAVTRARIEHCGPHDIRRSAARWMVEDGVPMAEVSRYLGHTSTAVTERVYAVFSPTYLRGAAQALEV